MALYATIYVALMGKEGMVELNRLSCDGAHYLYNRLVESGKFTPAFPGKPFLKEFVMKTELNIEEINARLLEAGFMGGINLGDGLVEFAVTEKRTKEEIESFINLLLA